MKLQRVSLEQAKKLHKLQFMEATDLCWISEKWNGSAGPIDEGTYTLTKINALKGQGIVPNLRCPRVAEALNWMRDAHDLHIEIVRGHDGQLTWYDAFIHWIHTKHIQTRECIGGVYRRYDAAEVAGLDRCLNLLIEDKKEKRADPQEYMDIKVPVGSYILPPAKRAELEARLDETKNKLVRAGQYDTAYLVREVEKLLNIK